MKNVVLFAILIVCPAFLWAQNPNVKRTWHWYFGRGAGIDFSSGTTVSDPSSAMYTDEGSAVISDTSGNLLFYSNGITVWNKTHTTMQNGTGLLGCYSTTQGALIVPLPGSDSLYYLFTNDCEENNLANGLRYNIVDMSLDNKNGAVILKNQLLHSLVSEKLAAVQGNNNDYWIVVHEWNSSNFLSYHLTEQGLDTVPIISDAQLYEGMPSGPKGYIKFTIDAERFAAVINENNIQICDFDKETGKILNNKYWNVDSTSCIYGLAFSPDKSKLYITNGCIPFSALYQYDLKSINISLSRKKIFNDIFSALGGMQLAADGKIYLSRYPLLQGNLGTKVTVINSPNFSGVLCGYDTSGIFLQNKYCVTSIPCFVETFFNGLQWVNTGDAISLKELQIYPNPSHNGVFYLTNLLCELAATIYDLNGKELCTIKTNNTGVLNFQILSSGIYLLKIETEHGINYQKLIIIK